MMGALSPGPSGLIRGQVAREAQGGEGWGPESGVL